MANNISNLTVTLTVNFGKTYAVVWAGKVLLASCTFSKVLTHRQVLQNYLLTHTNELCGWKNRDDFFSRAHLGLAA